MTKVLIIGESWAELRSWASELATAGLDASTAFSSAQAAEVARAEKPRVAVVCMRRESVIGFCEDLQRQPELSRIPTVVVTDVGNEKNEIEILECGVTDVVDSSVSPAVLVARVQARSRSVVEMRMLGDAIERLEEARAESERLAQSRSEFLANMSHEIRTPLTSILGYADLLLDPNASVRNRMTWIQTIRTSGEHLVSIVNDVLDMSKIESGKMSIETLSVSPFQLLEEVISLMKPRAKEKGLNFEINWEGAVPKSIETDPTRLRQILVNLTSNAVKFTDSGSVRIRCELLQGGECARMLFEVSDTGIGMTTEQASSLFQPFMQGDVSVPRRFGGSGLGLTISKRLAQLLGGDIEFESRAEEGSTFRVVLRVGSIVGVPLVRDAESDETAREAAADQTPASQPVAMLGGRVLLAEDVPANQRLISYYLQKAGLDVDVAENGEVALEKCRMAAEVGEGYDLILMDMQMPKVDGYTATATLRSEGYKLPIVALTAHALQGERDKCLRAGCSDFATKPIDREQLLALVGGILDDVVERASAGDFVPDTTLSDDGPIYSELVTSLGPGDPTLERMVEAFVRELSTRTENLLQGLNEERWEDVAKLAHQLKGAAGGYGYPSVSELSDRIEAICRKGGDDPAKLHSLGQELRALVARVEVRARDVTAG